MPTSAQPSTPCRPTDRATTSGGPTSPPSAPRGERRLILAGILGCCNPWNTQLLLHTHHAQVVTDRCLFGLNAGMTRPRDASRVAVWSSPRLRRDKPRCLARLDTTSPRRRVAVAGVSGWPRHQTKNLGKFEDGERGRSADSPKTEGAMRIAIRSEWIGIFGHKVRTTGVMFGGGHNDRLTLPRLSRWRDKTVSME